MKASGDEGAIAMETSWFEPNKNCETLDGGSSHLSLEI